MASAGSPGRIAAATAPTAAGGTPSTTRSAPATATAGSASARSHRPSSTARDRVCSWRAQADDLAGGSLAAEHGRERAVDQPDAHHGDTTERRHAWRPPGDEAGEGGDQAAVLLLQADADPQAVGQAVGAHLARDHPLGLEVGVGGGSVAAGAVGKLDQEKVAEARIGVQAKGSQLALEPG